MPRLLLPFVIIFLTPSLVFGAKKDFKGLFGSYRPGKYIENEGRSVALGVDLLLSTLIPISPVVESVEETGGSSSSLHYATFFNVELETFLTLGYNFELFARLGYYNYKTRKENLVQPDATLPLFHEFEMMVIPLVGGIKYRFGRDDIVPYVGVAAGLAYTERRGFYDYTTEELRKISTVLTGEFILGLEFFFAPNAGLRLEASVHYLQVDEETFDTGFVGPSGGQFPVITFQANPWSIRYASGLFILF